MKTQRKTYRTMHRTGLRLSVLLALAVSTVLSSPGQAQTTWTGTASSGWSTASNWSNGVPLTDGSEAVTITGTTSAMTSTIDAAWSATGAVSGLTLNPSTAALTVTAGTGVTSFTIGAGGITVGASGVTTTLSAPLLLSASQTWNIGTGSTFAIGGASFSYGSGVTMTKSGSGTLTLNSSSPTMSGGVVLNQGTIGFGLTGGSAGQLIQQFGTAAFTWQNNGQTNLQLGAFGNINTNSTFSNNIQFYDQGSGGGLYSLLTGSIASGTTLTFGGTWSSANSTSATGAIAQQILLNTSGTVPNSFTSGTAVITGNNSGLTSTSKVVIREGLWVLGNANAFGTNNNLAVQIGETSSSAPGLAALLATNGNNVTGTLSTIFNNTAVAGAAEFGLSGTGSVTFSGNLGLQKGASNGMAPVVFLNAGTNGIANFTGVISDSGSNTLTSAVVARGGGKVGLGGANTYAGGTTVGGGTALVVTNTAGSGVGTGAVNVGTAAVTLTGAGTTASSVAVTVTSTAGLMIGQTVTGTGIPAGTTILSINTGTNTVNLSQKATATGTVTLSVAAETGILGGSGIIAPTGTNGITVLSGSSVYPGVGGTAVQTLTLNGGSTTGTLLTMQGGASFTFNLGAGNTSDAIKLFNYVSGDLALNGNALNFSNAQAGTFTLFQFYSDAGTTLTADSLSSGLVLGTGLTGYTATLNYDANDISLTLVAVPEPSRALLLLFAGGLFAVARERRSSSLSLSASNQNQTT
ncbi:PEP-CTERM protein-sorting domain-containing protein [Verrucomicrobium sp. GAS474]|uniref:beta strand repeat-containing protein n=1 Tax=Verrucomicrobium sp. GAS474 TaxID=1882831 RepID=UPI000879EFB9|nr:PEP-CTERM sorting domain-containing protein [Verrucomicrobium sp. GAS474]SDT92957.1 PEP-CTERM protein-sorting domain-containing protein [Verrucomicrobium sp. GAS474]